MGGRLGRGRGRGRGRVGLLLGQVGGLECGGAPPILGLHCPHHNDKPAGLPTLHLDVRLQLTARLHLAAQLLPSLPGALPLNRGGAEEDGGADLPVSGPCALPVAGPWPPLRAPGRPHHWGEGQTCLPNESFLSLQE